MEILVLLVFVGLFIYALNCAIGYFGFGVRPFKYLYPKVRLVSVYNLFDEKVTVFKDKEGVKYAFPYEFPNIGAVKLNDDGTTSPYKQYYFGDMEYKWTKVSNSSPYLEL